MNASEYTNDGGTITLTAGSADGRIAFTIANTGCGLSPEDTRRVFERFWRGDAARSNTGVHCGLGLALVQRAAAALGGVIEADTRDGTFTVRLAFPASN
jgi:signal transduction histidine kinase